MWCFPIVTLLALLLSACSPTKTTESTDCFARSGSTTSGSGSGEGVEAGSSGSGEAGCVTKRTVEQSGGE